MAFNVAPVIPAISDFTVLPGVESATLSWGSTNGHPVQVWRDGVLIASVMQDAFVDGSLAADVEYAYMVRAVRQVSNGDLLFGTSASATVTPSRAALGEAQVETVHVAPSAITTRQIYNGGANIWVQQGTDGNGNVVPSTDANDVSPPAYFMGSGSEVVVQAVARIFQAYPIFRYEGSAAGIVECRILDITDTEDGDPPEAGILIDMQSLLCYGATYETFPGASHPATLVFNRDFDVNFVIETDPDRLYKVQFWFGIQNGNLGNFLYMMSDMQQVFWNEFKR